MTAQDQAQGVGNQWFIAETPGIGYFRENSGAFVIMEGEPGSDDRNRVGTVDLTVKAKRGDAWRTDDPKALARAHLISAAPAMLLVLRELEWSGEGDLHEGGRADCCPWCEAFKIGGEHNEGCALHAAISQATGSNP